MSETPEQITRDALTCQECGGPKNITGNCPACDLKLSEARGDTTD